jgi:hypothetical protein
MGRTTEDQNRRNCLDKDPVSNYLFTHTTNIREAGQHTTIRSIASLHSYLSR